MYDLIWGSFAVFGIITLAQLIVKWIYLLYKEWEQYNQLKKWKYEGDPE